MKRHSSPQALGTLSELNVTPLLDLAFVLLIIFMITAPLLSESIDLVIPSSKASRDAIDPAQIYKISLNAKREIFLNGTQLPLEELADGLRILREEKPGLAVVIESDRTLPVQDIVDIMDILAEVEIAKVAIVTKQATSP